MKQITPLSLVALGLLPVFGTTTVGAQAAPEAGSQSASGRLRGMMVCERVAQAANTDVLHVPLDMVVRGNSVEFARPTFNPDGTRVTGSELGSGTLDPDGKVHLTSEWGFRRFSLQGDYSGTLSSHGGTLAGTQTWHGPNGIAGSRTCYLAVVPAPLREHAAE
jgi:hypothetical protein